MRLFWRKGKRLRTVWGVEKDGRTSFLVGTAHFCPYRFEKALTELIHRAETVLFEGPLDQESMARVVQYGRQGEKSPSIYEALDPAAIKEINRQLSARLNDNTPTGLYLDFIHPTNTDFLQVYTRGVRPWMAFFTIWSAFLNWKYSMDMEAFHVAQKIGEKIHFLENIEEQLAALDGIPFERIVDFINRIEHWRSYKEQFLNYFLKGDLENMMSRTVRFPTRCESILDHRNSKLFDRMRLFFEEGSAVAFLGISHIPTMKEMFLDEGYRVTQEAL